MNDDKLSTDDEMWLFKSYSDQQDVEAVTEVLERGTWWAKGPEISEFEDQVANRADQRFGIAFNSGTSALYAMLEALNVRGGEVIVPSFTFPATPNSVIAAGAEPVFADIERGSLALDPKSVAEKITDETEAILPIHFAGDVCRGIHELETIADEHGIPLLEDAAHSIGATADRERVGSFGTAAMFSFCFNKVITTGEGGMVVTDSRQLKDRLEEFRSHGVGTGSAYTTWGHNLRMSSMTAALGVSQMDKFDYIVSERRRMASYLNDRLDGIEELSLPAFPESRDSVYQLYNLRFDETRTQAKLQNHLSERGIPTRVTYDPAHLTSYYRNEWGWEEGDLPVTEDVSKKILTLPFHLDLTQDDLDYLASSVIEYFESQ